MGCSAMLAANDMKEAAELADGNHDPQQQDHESNQLDQEGDPIYHLFPAETLRPSSQIYDIVNLA